MPKYIVRMEFNVTSSDYADVEVEANSREEAIKAALEKHEIDNWEELDFYSGKNYESELEGNQDDWLVEEK